MCGITGYVNWTKSPMNEPQIIYAMTQTLLPRGPDNNAVVLGDTVALGHTRLAVVDVEGGAQPMFGRSQHGIVALIFSGEVYNHVELRSELTSRGHHFHTRSDTEVVLRAWIEWGAASVERLVGMFAFAVHEDGLQTLTLVRDRLGVKPLFYAPEGDGVVFGSEIKAITAHPRVPSALAADGIAELFALAPNTSPGHAVLDGIHELLPGQMLIVTRDHIRHRRYWSWEPREHPDDLPKTIETVRGLLEEAVTSQLGADREVGALLSGGLDSSAIAAIAGRELDGLPTFAVDYADGGDYASSGLHVDRDTPYAEAVARHIGARHLTHYVTLDELIMAHAPSLEAMDLPSYPAINAPLRLLFERLRSEATVVLSGESADELFGGYHWHQVADATPEDFPWLSSYQPLDYLLRPDVAAVVRPAAYRRDRYREALDRVLYLPGEVGEDRRLREIHALTDEYYLRFLLARKDRMSMSVGTEVRVPFCDHRLVEYARSIPWAWRRDGGMEKGLLRQAVADLLPPDVAWRPKSGFPVAQNAAYMKFLWALARDMLADTSSPVWDLVDASAFAELLTRSDGDLGSWTATLHVGWVIDLATWLIGRRIQLV